MSAQKLAKRCEDLGLPMPRSVLANLESGRRHVITVPELLVLAEALGVPPVLLITPVDGDQVEIVPGRTADPWDALLWLAGLSRPDPDPGVQWALQHAALVSEWLHAADMLNPFPRLPGMLEDPMAHVVEDTRRSIATALRNVRSGMRALGLRPPALLPEMADIEKDDADE
jgi:transcriptional regulator with XRE-family HTH domain